MLRGIERASAPRFPGQAAPGGSIVCLHANFSLRSQIVSEALPVLYLARHGETAWTLSGQHTSLTDLPLTEAALHQTDALARRLKGQRFSRVFTSPLQRAANTCERVVLGDFAEID